MRGTNYNQLNPEQRAAHDALAALLQDLPRADEAYNRLPDSRGGVIISTDIARHLDRRYAETPSGQPRDLDPGWDLVWRYAQDRLQREIDVPRGRRLLRFMAGGWAAGKTHALSQLQLHNADLAWDGTLKDAGWAAEMIDLALRKGWRVEIAYVFRNLELAFHGAIERGHEEGRTVPLAELPANHRDVQQSILNLTLAYADEPKVSFILRHNLGSREVKRKPVEIHRRDLDRHGALHYGRKHERYYTQASTRFAENETPG